MFKNKIISKSIFIIILTIMLLGCTSNGCGYDDINTSGCALESNLNLSTGIDANGNLLSVPISPSDGIVDPLWRIINKPVTSNCNFTSDQNAFTVNLNNSSTTAWINQNGAVAISPFNSGNSNPGTCSNPQNGNGDIIPFVFERPFCIVTASTIDLNLDFKADNSMYIELFDNSTSTVVATSSVYNYPAAASNFTLSSLILSAGSYSLRCYLVNDASWIGFSVVGNITESNGVTSISNNVEGCCKNNAISVLNILELNCNTVFDSIDQLGGNWTFNLKDSNNTIIRTEITDINGNIFFSGLADGTYTIEIVNQSGYYQSSPTSGSYTVTIANNQVEILEFYNCNG